jgi:hypothetical protein
VGPTGTIIRNTFGSLSAEIQAAAPTTGKYTVVVEDERSAGSPGTGGYALTLAQVPGTFVVPAGDDGGAMTNGANHVGNVGLGDLDQWSFDATAGDQIFLKIGKTDVAASLQPGMTLVGPTGTIIRNTFGSLSAEIQAAAPTTGKYTVVVEDERSAGNPGTGGYSLTLAKAPGTLVVPVNDEGGSMTNGANHTGTILLGDLDGWTFSAAAGEQIIVRIAKTDLASTLNPGITLVGPTGAILRNTFGDLGAEIDVAAPETGTYTVIVEDERSAGNPGTGGYVISLAKAPGTFVVPTGDDGGAMVNGQDYTGQTHLGDVDQWTFTANVGDAITVTLDESTPLTAFDPWFRVVSPTGKIVANVSGTATATRNFTATEGGTYTVVVTDGTNYTGTAGYTLRVTLSP